MADTYSKTEKLNFDLFFVDGDTRVMTLKDPQENISSASIAALNTLIQTDNLLIGDNSGATFGKIMKVTKVTSETTKLDLDA